ncbi:hypothetical protein [[Mannheimia] succiniciproducens]|uniref:Uncharacterized protein n=1 Tax=Mannheimia succiniciproducens (strain KCTC 0769BP / MBEL55E) TaxID=221988 RepID=Q65WF4_MANSM|nr:hypothetical protein [[Mannheimia] succiniciproducens]AAU36706.1 unknown [[Mannheimia] succiniciproducens MBEL55E]
MEQEKINAALARVQEAGYKSSLMLALAEWAEQKLRQGETLDVASLSAWAADPTRKKAYSFAVNRFLAEFSDSASKDK